MEDIFKIGVLAVTAALCALVVKKQVPELGLALALVAGVVIFTMAAQTLQGVRDVMDSMVETAGLSPTVLAPVLKTVGIAVVTRVSSELCKDAKEGGIAAFVETAGAAAALYVSLPLLQTVLQVITGLL